MVYSKQQWLQDKYKTVNDEIANQCDRIDSLLRNKGDCREVIGSKLANRITKLYSSAGWDVDIEELTGGRVLIDIR